MTQRLRDVQFVLVQNGSLQQADAAVIERSKFIEPEVETSVHDNCLAGHIGGTVACQQQPDFGDLGRLPNAPDWLLTKDGFTSQLVVAT